MDEAAGVGGDEFGGRGGGGGDIAHGRPEEEQLARAARFAHAGGIIDYTCDQYVPL